MTIEELKVIITAQTAGLNREVSAARRQISGMQQQAVQAQGKVSSAFAGMKKAAIAGGQEDCDGTYGPVRRGDQDRIPDR